MYMEQKVRGLNLESLYYNKPVSQHVYEFCALIAIFLLFVAGYGVWHGKGIEHAVVYGFGAIVVLGLGKIFPRLILPTWKLWMGFAGILAMIVTPIVMTALWVLMFIPIGLALKIFSVKVLDLRFGEPVESYWEKRDPKKDNFKLLERQF